MSYDTVRVLGIIQTEKNMLGCGKTVKEMAKERSLIQMGQNTLGSGKMAHTMDEKCVVCGEMINLLSSLQKK